MGNKNFLGSSPRVMAVSTGPGTPGKGTQSGMMGNKPVQTVHLMAQAQTPRRSNVVLFQKGSATKNIPISQAGKVRKSEGKFF